MRESLEWWLLGRAVKRLNRYKAAERGPLGVLEVVVCGVTEPGGWWMTHRTFDDIGGKPPVVLGEAKTTGAMSERKMRRWLKNHECSDIVPV